MAPMVPVLISAIKTANDAAFEMEFSGNTGQNYYLTGSTRFTSTISPRNVFSIC
jgi:hypothetical protein